MRRVLCIGLMVLMVVCMLTACEEKAPPAPPTPPPPPPPSPEQIAGEINGKITPLLMQIPTPMLKQQLVSTISALKNQHNATENGKKALSMVRGQLEGQIKPTFDAAQFDRTLVLCDAVDAFQAGAPTAQRYRERALIEFNKPKVAIQAWATDENAKKTFVFLRIVLPETAQADVNSDGLVTYDELHAILKDLEPSEFRRMDLNGDGSLSANEVQFPMVKDIRVQEGEEFYGLKLVEIIGKQLGITLEYGKTGERFDVMYSQQ